MQSVLRIVVALLLIEHGAQNLFGFPPSSRGTAELLSIMGLAGVLETSGGLALLAGLFTRSAAFVLSGFTAAAYFMAHAPRDLYPVLNGGDASILFCFNFFYIAFAGGGSWGIDGIRSGKITETV